MSKENDLILKSSDVGVVYAKEDIVKIIAGIATKNVAGVADLSGKLIDVFNTKKKGVEVRNEEGNIRLEVSIGIIYGYKFTEIATRVQESVLKALNESLDLQNIQVDVLIKEVLVEGVTEEA